MTNEKTIALRSPDDLKVFLHKNYINQIKNFFGDEKRAMKFLSSVMADVQKTTKLLECDPTSLVNSYMVMAQMGFMPSGVSGEGYVLPYNIAGRMTAQFQMGYQGLVTLFYQAGVEKITSEVVREKDKTTFINGELHHEIDLRLSNEERGEIIGVYVKVMFRGVENTKFMNIKDIYEMGKRFSKSFDLNGKYSPWNIKNDPEFHMGRKTVLKQLAKVLPKNEIINKAIALDNSDSIISDRLNQAKEDSKSLQMGSILETPNEKQTNKNQNQEGEDTIIDAESNEIVSPFDKNKK